MSLKSWFKTVVQIEKELDMAQVNLSALRQTVADQAIVIGALEQIVARLQAAVAANNPVTIQAEVDSVNATVQANNQRMATLVETVPPDPPTQPT